MPTVSVPLPVLVKPPLPDQLPFKSRSDTPEATSIVPPPAPSVSVRAVRSGSGSAGATASVPPPENHRPPVVPTPMLLLPASMIDETCSVPPAIEVAPV